MSWKTVSMKKQLLAKSLALIFALVLIFFFPIPSFAVTKWKEIVPGETKKEEVYGILGEPKEINSSTYEYSPSEENIEKIVIEYKVVEPASIVDKIDVYFSEPIPKSDFAEAMKLPENADSQGEDPEGKLQEYYGSTKSLILTYKDETTKSGVKIVSYLSRERFESIELDPKDADIFYNWGVALHHLKDYGEAVEKYKKAAELDPNFVSAYYNWGLALYNQQDYEGAIEKCKKAAELDPNFVSAYYYWGLALEKQKRYKEAIEKFNKVIELDSNGKFEQRAKERVDELNRKVNAP